MAGAVEGDHFIGERAQELRGLLLGKGHGPGRVARGVLVAAQRQEVGLVLVSLPHRGRHGPLRTLERVEQRGLQVQKRARPTPPVWVRGERGAEEGAQGVIPNKPHVFH